MKKLKKWKPILFLMAIKTKEILCKEDCEEWKKDYL